MVKCCVCNQHIYRHGLCYLHYKYEQGLTGPYYDTLFDLLWAKATFILEWDKIIGSKLVHFVSDTVENTKRDLKRVVQIKRQIKKSLKGKLVDLTAYDPLVKKLAWKRARTSGVSFDELLQVGRETLIRLQQKVDKSVNIKQLSHWVKVSVMGKIMNYTRNNREDNEQYVEGSVMGTTEIPDQLYVREEKRRLRYEKIQEIKKHLTKRQRKMFDHILMVKCVSQKELSRVFRVSTRTIRSDYNNIVKVGRRMHDV